MSRLRAPYSGRVQKFSLFGTRSVNSLRAGAALARLRHLPSSVKNITNCHRMPATSDWILYVRFLCQYRVFCGKEIHHNLFINDSLAVWRVSKSVVPGPEQKPLRVPNHFSFSHVRAKSCELFHRIWHRMNELSRFHYRVSQNEYDTITTLYTEFFTLHLSLHISRCTFRLGEITAFSVMR